MNKLILGQIKRLSTQYVYELAIAIIKVLFARGNSSMVNDARTVVSLLKKNMEEDKEAGFTDKPAYSRERRR